MTSASNPCLNGAEKKGIKLNKEKSKFSLSEVSFMGHIISNEGLKPDPAKIQGICEMPTPKSVQDVTRLLHGELSPKACS